MLAHISLDLVGFRRGELAAKAAAGPFPDLARTRIALARGAEPGRGEIALALAFLQVRQAAEIDRVGNVRLVGLHPDGVGEPLQRLLGLREEILVTNDGDAGQRRELVEERYDRRNAALFRPQERLQRLIGEPPARLVAAAVPEVVVTGDDNIDRKSVG